MFDGIARAKGNQAGVRARHYYCEPADDRTNRMPLAVASASIVSIAVLVDTAAATGKLGSMSCLEKTRKACWLVLF